MCEFGTVMKQVSWSNDSNLLDSDRSEFKELVLDRGMTYAPVDNHKSFCAEMKNSTGRLMDFNKGMTMVRHI